MTLNKIYVKLIVLGNYFYPLVVISLLHMANLYTNARVSTYSQHLPSRRVKMMIHTYNMCKVKIEPLTNMANKHKNKAK